MSKMDEEKEQLQRSLIRKKKKLELQIDARKVSKFIISVFSVFSLAFFYLGWFSLFAEILLVSLAILVVSPRHGVVVRASDMNAVDRGSIPLSSQTEDF